MKTIESEDKWPAGVRAFSDVVLRETIGKQLLKFAVKNSFGDGVASNFDQFLSLLFYLGFELGNGRFVHGNFTFK